MAIRRTYIQDCSLRDVCKIARDKEETEKRERERERTKEQKHGGSNFANWKTNRVDLAI